MIYIVKNLLNNFLYKFIQLKYLYLYIFFKKINKVDKNKLFYKKN